MKNIDWIHLLCLLVCKVTFGTIHIRAEWKDDGIHCVDCGFFKDKATHMADMHAGGGW